MLEPALDLEWLRHHLLEEIPPRWLAHAATPNGAFLPQLDREWRPLPDPGAALASQTRLLCDFVQGWAVWRTAVAPGGPI